MNLEKFVEKNAPKNRIALLVITDIFLITLSGFMALYIRYDFRFSLMDMQYVDYELKYLPLSLVATLLLFVLFKLYRSVWRFASSTELLNVIGACTCSMAVQIIGMSLLGMRMPVSYYLMKYVILIIGVGLVRFAYRILRMLQERRLFGRERDSRKNTMIVGGGEAGAMIIKEFQNSSYLNQRISCVIDDNASKQGKYLRGIKIMGGREDIVRLAEELKIDEIIVAMPSAPQSEVRDILNICKETGCEMRVLPGLYQMIKGEVSISKLAVPAKMIGKTVVGVNLRGQFGLNIIAIENAGKVNESVGPNTTFQEGDILFVSGGKDAVNKMADWLENQ